MAASDDLQHAQSYSLLAKLFHWGFVVLFIYGVAKQVDDISQLADEALLRFEVLFALSFLGLLVLRFIYMNKTQKTALLVTTPLWQKRAARLVHLGMYVSFSSIALTGLAIAGLFRVGFDEGLLIEAVAELHGIAVLLSYWLVAIHIMAAIYHRYLQDGVWNSMVFFWREKR